MFKIIFFLWRQPFLSRDQFVDYYENHHAPLGSSLSPPMPDYRRNYPHWHDAERNALGGFDVMTEIWHGSRATFEAQITGIQQSPTQEIMAEDEDKFIIRARQLFIAVDELGQDEDNPLPAGQVTKMLRFVRAPAGMSAADFRDAYEQIGVPATRAGQPPLAGYRRNYALYDDPYTFSGGTGNVTPTSQDERLFHLVEEIWHQGPPGDFSRQIDLGAGIATALHIPVLECRSSGGTPAAPLSGVESIAA